MSAKSKRHTGSVEDRIRSIYDRWFLADPALHAVLCASNVRPDSTMACAIRAGGGRIDYQPEIMDEMNFDTIEMLFRSEVIRIMLKHPYSRRPEDCPSEILTIASNCVLTDNYDFEKITLDKTIQHGLERGGYYELYARELNRERNSSNTIDDERKERQHQQSLAQQNQQSQQGHVGNILGNDRSKADQSELWREDEMAVVNINKIIQNVRQWGTLPGKLVEEIEASTRRKIDYRKVISGFRSSIMSSRRSLTRMRPNRRTDFDNMGSIYRLSTSLLVAIDVSGSIDDRMVADFYSVVNRFFRYGIEKIDTVQFDVEMGEIEPIKKAQRRIVVKGRGGTSYQMLMDYVAENGQYDGLVILTDGYAQKPVISKQCHTKAMWVCATESDYETHHEWMEKMGRCCVIR